ncbi:hypothetical protein ACI3PL_23560, partial [Lacticaseibacillus paracasei]
MKAYIASYKDGMKALRATDAAEIAALKAEVERLKASVRLACSDDTERAARLIRMAESGNTVKPADDSGQAIG